MLPFVNNVPFCLDADVNQGLTDSSTRRLFFYNDTQHNGFILKHLLLFVSVGPSKYVLMQNLSMAQKKKKGECLVL